MKYSHRQTKYMGKQVGLRTYRHPCISNAVLIVFYHPIGYYNQLRIKSCKCWLIRFIQPTAVDKFIVVAPSVEDTPPFMGSEGSRPCS
jgi:hypothetical protein